MLARAVGGFGLATVIVAVNLAVALWLRAVWASAQEAREAGAGRPTGAPGAAGWPSWPGCPCWSPGC